jgi:TusA-related sulfurtransferase
MELVGGGAPELDEAAVATVVDCRGMLCAQGILRLMRALVSVPPGGVVKVLSSDPAAEHDYPAWCRTTGHSLLGHRREPDPRWGALVVSFIRKRDAQPPP